MKSHHPKSRRRSAMTIDEAIEKIKELNREQPSLDNYHQIMGDAYRVMYAIATAVKELQDAAKPTGH